MNIKSEIIAITEGFKQCFNVAPLPVISLVIYVTLRSRAIFPDELAVKALSPQVAPKPSLWQPAYFGWYDLLFFFTFISSFALGYIKFFKQNLVFILILALIIILSFVHGSTFGYGLIWDAFIYFFRFIFAFCFAAWLVKEIGSRATESLVIVLFVLLAITSLFVYTLIYPQSFRMYASGMTTASFSQVAVVVCLVSFWRKYNLLFITSLLFLFLTFSKTSIIIFLTLVLFHLKATLSKIAKFATFILLSFPVLFYLLASLFGQRFYSFLAVYTSLKQILTLSGRTEIWSYAGYLLESGQVPLLGLGFNAASSLILSNNFYLLWNDFAYLVKTTYYYPPTFHSIWIEYGFGLGILSIIIFSIILKRIWQTFCHQCQPAFFIFSFFILCQSVDYTFYRPKEVIIWSLILGLAEGQWRVESETH